MDVRHARGSWRASSRFFGMFGTDMDEHHRHRLALSLTQM
jgi:hypothetical protein